MTVSGAGTAQTPKQREVMHKQGWEVGSTSLESRDPHSVMILPQVHLRKPCYDFYFL